MLRENYDSRAISTGLAVGEIFSGLEIEYIANRKKVLKAAVETGDVRSELMRNFDAYNRANKNAAVNALNRAKRLAEEELERSYEVGVRTTDRVMEAYKSQGAEVELSREEQIGIVLRTGLSSLLAGMIQSVVYSQDSARRQYILLANQLPANATAADIDQAQGLLLNRGVAGGREANGTERQLTSNAELLMRQSSHDVLVSAEGRRAAEYGFYLVQVSAHPSSCPLCAPWQGKILVDNVNNDGVADGKHELLSTALAAGLGHINCRHNWVAVLPGYERPDFFDYDKASPKETAERYAVEQEQRYNERMIRMFKRNAAGAVSEDKRLGAERKVEEWQARQRELKRIAESKGIPFYRQYSREQITDKAPNIKIPESNLTKAAERVTMRQKEAMALPPEQFRAEIQSGHVNLHVLPGRQNKHIKGTNEKNQSPEKSIITIDLEKIPEIVNKYAGTGQIMDAKNDGQQKESVELPFEVGMSFEDGKWVKTNRIIIHYLKDGVHIVPVRPK